MNPVPHYAGFIYLTLHFLENKIMGCDIHMYAEKRKDINSNWEEIGKVFKYPYYNPERESKVDEDGFEWNAKFTRSPYCGRNYNLFAILADVRNGSGFAGIKTSEGFNPIAEPKGLPIDVSSDILEEDTCLLTEHESLSSFESWVDRGISQWVQYGKSVSNPDHHSHSWFTVQELLDYDWHQITVQRGSIRFEEYKRLKESDISQPESWCGMVAGMNIANIEEDEADMVIEGNIRPDLVGKELYVNYHWSSVYSDSCKGFLEETIPELLKHGDPENVRIVFWFDN